HLAGKLRAVGISEASPSPFVLGAGSVNPTRNIEDSRISAAAAPASKRPEIDGYRIIHEIGHGGMGHVFQAVDLQLNRVVAIKTIGAAAAARHRRELFNREARLAASLRHSNIVTIFSFQSEGPTPYFVMEWVDGEPLDAFCRHRNLSPPEVIRILEKIALAVAYAHDCGVVHRDLKPQNILVDKTGEPRVLDFGLARLVAGAADSSSIGSPVKGTLRYMAPEQVLDPREVGQTADIFALGLIMYELFTGLPPPAPPGLDDHGAWQKREIPLPREANPDLPEALQRICLKAAEIDPKNRYRSARHLADDLRRFLEGRPILTRPTRYAQLLEGRVREQIDVLNGWEQDQLISHRELDSLHERYLALLRSDSLWVPGARKLRIGPILTQLGGWFLVLSAILWPWFYWNYRSDPRHVVNLGALGKVLFEALPTILVNRGAFRLWARGNKLVALIFTVTGILLVPVCLAVVLGVTGILGWRQVEELEVFPLDYFSNIQVTAALAVALGYGLWWLKRRPYALLAATVALLGVLLWASILCLLGMKEWLKYEMYADTAIWWLPLTFLAYCGARLLDRPRWDHLAVPFYAAAAISFLVITATLALDAPESWLHLPGTSLLALSGPHPEVDQFRAAQEVLLFLCGLLYLAIALVHDRSKTRLRRLWGAIYFRIVPPMCLLSWDLLGDEPIEVLISRGHHVLTPIELTVPLLCFALAALSMRFQLRWFLYYSLLHLAWFIFRTTDRYLQNALAWPFTLLFIGILALGAGLLIEHIRRRENPTDTPTPSPPAGFRDQGLPR
ncbi:MAG TPA: serine/threonine-protein kinase, partial [Phycisphaerae bacterium]|nr:serine/threonine-protein kinase [Phycisphaerae bacterium]